MKSIYSVFFLMIIVCSSAFADEGKTFKQLIEEKQQELKNGKVAAYRLAWGKENPVYEKIITAAKITTTPSFSSISRIAQEINSASGGNLFAGNATDGSSVLNVIIDNEGAYTSSKTQATVYADRNYMNTYIYCCGYNVIVANLGSTLDFGTAPDGTPFLAFYTTSGHVNQFILLYNQTSL